MIARKTLTEKAQRRKYQLKLRALASRVVTLVAVIEATEKSLSVPGSPYREMLGAVEEYYNQLADEFDDIPDERLPLQSFDTAMRKVRELHLASCREPLSTLARDGNAKGKLRNAGPNADTAAGFLLSDAIGMLEAVHNKPKESVTLAEYETQVREVIGVLRELENDPAQGIDASKDVHPDSGLALLEDAIAQIETAKQLSEDPDSRDADLQTHIESALVLLRDLEAVIKENE